MRTASPTLKRNIAPIYVSVFCRKPNAHTLQTSVAHHLRIAKKLRGQEPSEVSFHANLKHHKRFRSRFFNLHRCNLLAQNCFSLTLFRPSSFFYCLAHIEAEHRSNLGFGFLPKTETSHAANVCGTSSSHCKLASRPDGQRASFSSEYVSTTNVFAYVFLASMAFSRRS